MPIEVSSDDLVDSAKAMINTTEDTPQVQPSAPEPVVESVTPIDPGIAADKTEAPFSLEAISDGMVRNEDELREVLGKVAQFDELRKRVEEYELSTSQTTFANDYLKGLNDWMLKGGDKEIYDKIHTVKVDELDKLQAVKLEMLSKDSSLDPQDVEEYLIAEFKQGEYDDDQEKKIGAVKLSMAARNAKDYLQSLQRDNALPEPERKRLDIEKIESERINQWDKTLPVLVKEFETVKVRTMVGDNEVVIDYKPSKEERESLMADFKTIIKSLPAPDENGVKETREWMENRLKLIAYPNILGAVAAQVSTNINDGWIKSGHNPSAVKRGDAPVSVGSDGTDQLFDKVFNNLRGNSLNR